VTLLRRSAVDAPVEDERVGRDPFGRTPKANASRRVQNRPGAVNCGRKFMVAPGQ
jgi:hypothetical protein